jgi:diacylglycerol kinase family enzyme
MARIALLSNPKSTGNKSQLPRIRSFCAQHPDIFHYEVEKVDQIGEAMRTIARVEPKAIVINGGDGTVQVALTELCHGGYFNGTPPPVAVLPNGKTNLIALDLGATGDPLVALERVLEIVRTGVDDHVVARELISLTDDMAGTRPVVGMFLGGAGLADAMLYCRNKLYPLGLPNGLAHVVTVLALLLSLMLGIKTGPLLPPRAQMVRVSIHHHGAWNGRFALLIVTTLEKLLMNSTSRVDDRPSGALQLVVVDHTAWAFAKAIMAGIFGRLGSRGMRGVRVERGDEIRIEGERSSVILDGELFEAGAGRAIVLKPTAPLPFLRLAA